MTVAASSVALHIADYVTALASVYTLVIIAYILTSLVFAAGLRIPYSRWSDAILGFLREVTEPYLRLFRRFLPSFGGLDFSPLIAIIVLQLAARLISSALRS
jgi:YggT family protein